VRAPEAETLGFRIQILAGAALQAAFHAIRGALQTIKDTGQQPAVFSGDATPATNADIGGITDVLGLPAVYELEQKYMVTS
jgi:2-methylisocitrate lyase-like PEP mutase family enzyme